MKKRSVYFGLVAALLAVALLATTLITAGAANNNLSAEEIDAIVNTTTDASQVTSPFIEVANKVRNSVVGVNNYTSRRYSYYGYGYGRGNGNQDSSRETLSGTGSGVVITKYGHVLTNYHVVEGASRVTVTTALDKSEHEATVVGTDANLDIAVLYVEGLGLEPVELGDSDQLQVGEWAIVIGNPLGEDFARTLTVGTVSAIDREVTDSSTDRYGRRTTTTNSMIQVDAAINSGNSGGGLFNTLGQLQGIPARKYSSNGFFSTSIDNIGMCIPINDAKALIKQVLQEFSGVSATTSSNNKEEKTNTVNSPLQGKPRLGVTVTTLTGMTSNILPQGALVINVEDGSPAEEGGILAGDIIVELDGSVIPSHSALTQKLANYREGDKIAIKVYRDEALAEQIEQDSIDLSEVGDGEYVDVTVTLRVIDDLNS